MGAIELAGAVADPQEVGRTVVPVARQRVPAGEGLLVAEDQGFVAGPELHLVQGGLGSQVDAAGGHEPKGPVDLRGDGLVPLALVARGDELLVPHVHLGEVGKAAGGERPEEVQGRRRLVVGGQHPGRVRNPRLGRRAVVVDDVAPEARQGEIADPLGGRGPGLGELTGDAAQLDHLDAGAVGQHDGHLEDHLQLVPDGVGGEVGKGLGAVARLEQECPAGGDLGEGRPQAPCLPGEHERGQDGERLERGLEGRRVRPFRLLGSRQVAPGARGPGVVHSNRVAGAGAKHKAVVP